jgi:hypothetical protein
MHRTYLAITAAGAHKFADQVLKSEGPFACLGCGDRLIARQGSVRAWHYAHGAGAGTANCGESQLHRTAKYLVCAHLHRWRFQLRCWQCDAHMRVRRQGHGKGCRGCLGRARAGVVRPQSCGRVWHVRVSGRTAIRIFTQSYFAH